MSISNYDPGQDLSSINFDSMIGGPLRAIVDAQAQAAISTVDFVKEVGFNPDTENVTTGEVTPGTPVYVGFKYPKMVQPYQPAINGAITSITVSNGGSGYSSNLIVTVSGTGSGATATATVNSSGTITAINVTNAGSGYDSTTTISVTDSSGSGSGATFTVNEGTLPAVPAVFAELQLEVPILTMLPIPFIRVEEGEIDFHAKITSMEYANVGSNFSASTSFAFNKSNSRAYSGKKLKKNRQQSIDFKVNASYQRTSRKGHKVDKTYQLGVKVKVAQDDMPAGMDKVLGILEDAIVGQPV